ncbi:NAC domain-containing protein 71-like isoform X2 [Primulina tabacum]|uniref:NAC domain-containing protein 71-like isoform X2 n=1 Tax=Primulina tabacum TaxID=48773 RepID=UPI003F592771
MAVDAAMNTQEENSKQDEHENDMIMPGFRFHPTEEELVEFYLRRKVEGKRFNVELITFLDLYRYDPWELPAFAAIGEKEWYFYVPRDKKYRNGDRPNRVTTSGYWKATGADRMIRSENLSSIGLKKTLVFYSGKAPKGIRTTWIMNEYRLPQHETERLQKAEISLCRVYKRAGIENHSCLPRSLPTKGSLSSARASKSARKTNGKMSKTRPCSSTDIGTSLAHGSKSDSFSTNINSFLPIKSTITLHNSSEHDRIISHQSKSQDCTAIFARSSSHSSDPDLHKLVNIYSQQAASNLGQENQHYSNNSATNILAHFSTLQQQQQQQQLQLQLPVEIPSSGQIDFSNRVWDWNAVSEASNKDHHYTNLYK